MIDFPKLPEETVPRQATRLNPFATDNDPPEVRIAAKALYDARQRNAANQEALARLRSVIEWKLQRWWQDGEPTSQAYYQEREALQQVLTDFAKLIQNPEGSILCDIGRRQWVPDLGGHEWFEAAEFIRNFEDRERSKLGVRAGRTAAAA